MKTLIKQELIYIRKLPPTHPHAPQTPNPDIHYPAKPPPIYLYTGVIETSSILNSGPMKTVPVPRNLKTTVCASPATVSEPCLYAYVASSLDAGIQFTLSMYRSNTGPIWRLSAWTQAEHLTVVPDGIATPVWVIWTIWERMPVIVCWPYRPKFPQWAAEAATVSVAPAVLK